MVFLTRCQRVRPGQWNYRPALHRQESGNEDLRESRGLDVLGRPPSLDEVPWQPGAEITRCDKNPRTLRQSSVSTVAGFQGVLLVLTPMVTAITTTAPVSGRSSSYLTWTAFAALLICGITTALQAGRIGRIGTGHVLFTAANVSLVVVGVPALQAGRPGLLSALVVCGALAQFALATWLPFVRRIITPVVKGTALMLLAATVIPIAAGRVSALPDGVSQVGGVVVAGTTLGVLVVLRTTGSGRVAAVGPAHGHRRGITGRSALWPVRLRQGGRVALGRCARDLVPRFRDSGTGRLCRAAAHGGHCGADQRNQEYGRQRRGAAAFPPPDPGDRLPVDAGLTIRQRPGRADERVGRVASHHHQLRHQRRTGGPDWGGQPERRL